MPIGVNVFVLNVLRFSRVTGSFLSKEKSGGGQGVNQKGFRADRGQKNGAEGGTRTPMSSSLTSP